MLQQATDVVKRIRAQVAIGSRSIHDIRIALPDALMDMHPGAVVKKYRFRHESRRFAMFSGDVLDDVLILHQFIRRGQQGIESNIDFTLPGGGHFMMVALHTRPHTPAFPASFPNERPGVYRWAARGNSLLCSGFCGLDWDIH